MAARATEASISTLSLRIAPNRIGYLKFILEGYDGMALVTTLNVTEGVIAIRYPASFHDDLTAIIDDVSSLIFQTHAE